MSEDAPRLRMHHWRLEEIMAVTCIEDLILARPALAFLDAGCELQ